MSRAEPTARSSQRRRRSLAVALIAVGVVVGLTAAIGVRLSGSHAEFLSQPVDVGEGGELVAFELDHRLVSLGDPVRMTLYLRGGKGAGTISPVMTPVGLDGMPEQGVRLSGATLDLSNTRRVDVVLPTPPFTGANAGAYTFRIPGRAPTFGLVELVDR